MARADRRPLPFFGGAEAELQGADGPEAEAALGRFLALGEADRRGATRHLAAYYDEVRHVVGSEEVHEDMGFVPEGPEALWRAVRPRFLTVRTGGGEPLVAMEGACGWEPEHGLQMVWRDGGTLIRLGPCDGHLRNRDPRAVYEGGDPRWTTRA